MPEPHAKDNNGGANGAHRYEGKKIPSIWFTLIAMLASAAPAAGEEFPMASSGNTADIHVSDGDWKVARIAAGDLALDDQRITGRKPAVKDRGIFINDDIPE